jgi:hypothetical protein
MTKTSSPIRIDHRVAKAKRRLGMTVSPTNQPTNPACHEYSDTEFFLLLSLDVTSNFSHLRNRARDHLRR